MISTRAGGLFFISDRWGRRGRRLGFSWGLIKESAGGRGRTTPLLLGKRASSFRVPSNRKEACFVSRQREKEPSLRFSGRKRSKEHKGYRGIFRDIERPVATATAILVPV